MKRALMYELRTETLEDLIQIGLHEEAMMISRLKDKYNTENEQHSQVTQDYSLHCRL
jgi:hypothetical protein